MHNVRTKTELLGYPRPKPFHKAVSSLAQTEDKFYTCWVLQVDSDRFSATIENLKLLPLSYVARTLDAYHLFDKPGTGSARRKAIECRRKK